MVDVERLLEKLRLAKISLGKVKEANDQAQLNETFKEFGADVAALQQARVISGDTAKSFFPILDFSKIFELSVL